MRIMPVVMWITMLMAMPNGIVTVTVMMAVSTSAMAVVMSISVMVMILWLPFFSI
jgi:hypothetical protein